jgi:chromosome segregation ATPase
VSESITKAEIESILAKLTETMTARFGEVSEKIDKVDARLDRGLGAISELRERIDKLGERLDRVEVQVYDRIERVETNLLTAFHNWARPTEVKMRASLVKMDALGNQVGGFEERMSLLEERMYEVERRLMQRNPPAA